jgi:GT2 family glycosyltransferase
MKGMERISLVVVTWESRADLARLLDSMLSHLDPAHELVVVDNASDDDPEAEVARWAGPARFERLDRNRGFGAASNAGVALASSDAVVLVNPDVELLDDGLEALSRMAAEAGALVGPRLLNPDRSPQPSASGPVVGAWPWVGAIVPGAIQPAPVRARTEPWRLERTTEVAWLTGACIAAPRATMEKLGPFDPAIELMSEDLDLGLRASKAGIPSLFAPEACSVVHHGRTALVRRFDDAGLALALRNRRAAIARRYGRRRERRAWRAHLLRLRLRSAAKRALRGDREDELAEIHAAGRASRYEEI